VIVVQRQTSNFQLFHGEEEVTFDEMMFNCTWPSGLVGII